MDDHPAAADAPPPDAPAPDLRMRTTGFLLTVVGALVAGIGAMLEWVTVAVPGVPDDVSPTDRGVDLLEGTVALGLAIVALVAVLVTRIGATGAARKGAAVLTLVAGVVLVAIAGGEAITAGSRFLDDAAREVAEVLDVTPEQASAQLEGLLEVRLGTGLWLTLAGGLAVAAGGLVTLAWATRRARATPVERSDAAG